jgi:hypothetical protein
MAEIINLVYRKNAKPQTKKGLHLWRLTAS